MSQAQTSKDDTLRPKEQWVEAFERQFPDLIDNPIARMCYREGWANANAYDLSMLLRRKRYESD